jgi:hypothetical protein
MRWVLTWVGEHRRIALLLLVAEVSAALLFALSAGGAARGQPSLPANDLNNLLALTGVPTPATAPVQENPEPPLAPSPRAVCGAGSRPLAGVQGRVPASAIQSPAAALGWTCNLTVVSHQGASGGFKVWRYIDQHGHECAFYDTALLFPLNAVSLIGPPSVGVAVLDMSDQAHPVQTDTLATLPMRSPHESLNLNVKRGLLAADTGNPASYPGLMSIYDVSQDCRHPVLDSTVLAARFGHESAFSPDGRTFWISGGGDGIAAVDVTDPKNPRTLGQWNEFAHGMSVSDDGNTLYVADSVNGNLTTIDVSQVQARRANPVVREISRLTWNTVTIPQNAYPMQIHAKPYLLEFDEYAFRFSTPPPPDTVGAARIIDISDPAHPRVVSNIRLEVNQPAQHHAADGDPGTLNPVQGYAAHYCSIPREVDPEIVACSFINSGLRIFNIQDPLHPREVAYFVSPPKRALTNGGDGSDFAMSHPAFAPERREVWYSDGTSGFYDLRLDPSVWPDPTSLPTPTPSPSPSCARPSGRLSGTALGPVKLGDTRSEARRQFRSFSTRGHRNMDFFCLAGSGIRDGYPSARLLRGLSRAAHHRVENRVILILTANRFYALDGVRSGAHVAAIARRLGLGKPYRVGLNDWYLLPGKLANGVFKVRRGVVEEIGLADLRLTGGRRAAWRFFTSF